MPAPTNAARRRGFTLVEALVTMALMCVVMVGLLTMLEAANRMAKQESNVARAQGNARSGLYELVRVLRQARVGQLYWGSALLPHVNNAGPGATMIDISGTAHTVREGTDAIEVRGIFFGAVDYLGAGDVSCAGGDCASGSSAITVTIRQTTILGVQNYPAGSRPVLANRTAPFYYAIAGTSTQPVTVGAQTYLAPLTVMGKVDTTGSWYTDNGTSFTFVMDATDAGALQRNASNSPPPLLQSPYAGGAIDDVIFYVDRGRADATAPGTYPHPYLAEAVLDARSGRWDVQPIVDDAEDLQLAYGIDGADGSTPDGGVDPTITSRTAGGDEWVLNAAGETLAVAGTPPHVDAFLDSTIPSAAPYFAAATPRLKSLLVSLVVKSREPDARFAGPGAWGVKSLDSSAVSVSTSTNRPYRRRVQSMAVNLRNYQ